MAQPSPYFPGYNFTDFQASSPSTPLPASQVDSELLSIASSLNTTITNIGLIQRDDGYLANQSVGLDQLSGEVIVQLGVTAPWLTATAYTLSTLVLQTGNVYICAVAHTSGTFATDLAAGKWTLLLGAASSAMADVVSAASHAAGRTALGSTTVGDAIFIASSASVARAAIGATTVGDAVFIASSATAARTALALGTIATQAASAVAITGGTVTTSTVAGNLIGADMTRCTSQLDKTTSAALSNITGMVQTVVAGTYGFRIHLSGTSGASGGWKVAFKLTTAVITSWDVVGRGYTAAAVAVQHTTTTTDQTTLLGVTALEINAEIEGTGVIGTGGTMQLQFAQNVSDGTTCSIYVGSYMRFWRIS